MQTKTAVLLALVVGLALLARPASSESIKKGKRRSSFLQMPRFYHEVKRHAKIENQPSEPHRPDGYIVAEGYHKKPATDNASVRQSGSPSSRSSVVPDPVLPDVTPNGVVDVGTVKSLFISESCNGALLDPSVVLTSASCIHADHSNPQHQNVTFVFNNVVRKVDSVYANPEWHATGTRRADFALLKLANPMTGLRASHPVQITWSPYALEDVGQSLMALPAATSCQTASKKAQRTDQARVMNDQIITLSCTNRATALKGSPIYRLVDGRPVVYGVYFGSCTSGSLDRKVTGSCGARITKEVFIEFCTFTNGLKNTLPDCSSTLLNKLDEHFPTTVNTNELFAAVKSTGDNTKGAVFVYHSSASPKNMEIINDIEAIQRLKLVYDKFQMAVVDIQTLPRKVTYVPYIEYRTTGGKTFLPYNDKYDYKQFKTFMSTFSRVGAPPSGSTSFLQYVNLEKRSSVSGSGEFPEVLSYQIRDGLSDPENAYTRSATCDTNAYQIRDVNPVRCQCLPGYIGSGSTGQCQSKEQAIATNCRFDIDSSPTGQTLSQLKTAVAASTWCKTLKIVVAYLNNHAASVAVSGYHLTWDECVTAIEDLVACSEGAASAYMADDMKKLAHERQKSKLHLKDLDEDMKQYVRTTCYDGHKKSTSGVRSKRSVHFVPPVPPAFFNNFLLGTLPAPLPLPPGSAYIYQDWKPTASNMFSTIFSSFYGEPVLSAYKLTNAQLTSLAGPTARRAAAGNYWYRDPGIPRIFPLLQGEDDLYRNRGNKTAYNEAVDKGHLNPSNINSYNVDTMKLTQTYTNAYPQFSYFHIGVWKTYEGKIVKYAKNRCRMKDPTGNTAQLHLMTGLSDVEIVPHPTIAGSLTTIQHMPRFWPVEFPGAPAKPLGSPPLPAGVQSIKQAFSMWTVGCCTYNDPVSGLPEAESISIWANNKGRYIPNLEIQPDLRTLGQLLYPYLPVCFSFFPANNRCDDPTRHFSGLHNL